MASKLKEQMQRAALRKEEKRAERESEVTLKDGPAITAKLASGRQLTRLGLIRMRQAVGLFRDGGHTLDMALKQMSARKRMLYALAKAEFQSDMMANFETLTERLPEEHRDRPFAMSWDQWRAHAGTIGMNDEQLLDALRIMLVFRDR